jgi:hypothetical protein
MPRLMIFPQRLPRALYHRVHAVPLIFRVVQMKLLRTQRALQRNLIWRQLHMRSCKGDHGKHKLAYSLFVRHRDLRHRNSP